MTTKSKIAIALALASLGLASPAFAQSPRAANWDPPAHSRQVNRNVAENPAFTGGGSTGYNVDVATDY